MKIKTIEFEFEHGPTRVKGYTVKFSRNTNKKEKYEGELERFKGKMYPWEVVFYRPDGINPEVSTFTFQTPSVACALRMLKQAFNMK